MATYLVVFVGALVLAIVGTPLARKVGLRLNAVDQPDARRKVHTVPTPRLGGLAIYGSTLLAALLLGNRYNITQLVSILVGATMVSFLGFWDDRFTLSPWIKLAGQLVAAVLLVVTEVSITMLRVPLLNYAVTVLWIVGITNAMNLLDNMDGLSGGIAAIAAAYFALMCSFSGQYLVGALAVAVMAMADWLMLNQRCSVPAGPSWTLPVAVIRPVVWRMVSAQMRTPASSRNC